MVVKINDRIRTRKIELFNGFTLDLRYDAVGSPFKFLLLFNPENKDHVDMACPGHLHICTVEHNDELLITGTMLTGVFNSDSSKELISIAGYSLPGVLEDCEIPTSAYPLESDSLCLREMAEKYVAPFGIKIKIDAIAAAAMEEKYDECTAKETQTVKSFLSEMASQKNIIVSHDEFGRLLFTKANPNQKPIFHFKKGEMPGTKMTLNFDGQKMHSQISVLRQEDEEELVESGESTIMNPYIPYAYRPKVIIQSSSEDRDITTAANNALAKELKGLSITVDTDRWIIDGKIIRPGKIISITNPDIYIFKKTEFFIESVSLTGDKDKTTAKLHCVIPEVYTGQPLDAEGKLVPKYIWKGINIR